MTEFPSVIRLVDTRERRLPVHGEYYCWRNGRTGVVSGPWTVEPDDDEPDFVDGPANYAIYRREDYAIYRREE